MINPFDEYAVEEALRLVEKHRGSVTAVCVGPPKAAGSLRRVLAMGADRAILASDPALAGSDTLGTARALAAVLPSESFDRILCGQESVDRAATSFSAGRLSIAFRSTTDRMNTDSTETSAIGGSRASSNGPRKEANSAPSSPLASRSLSQSSTSKKAIPKLSAISGQPPQAISNQRSALLLPLSDPEA